MLMHPASRPGFTACSTLLYNLKQLQAYLFNQFCHMHLTRSKVNTLCFSCNLWPGSLGLAAADRAFPLSPSCFLVATLLLAPWPLALCIAPFVNSWISVSLASMSTGQGRLSSKGNAPLKGTIPSEWKKTCNLFIWIFISLVVLSQLSFRFQACKNYPKK